MIDDVWKEFGYDDVMCLCFSFHSSFGFPIVFFFFAMASILTKKPSHKQYDSMKQDWIDECSVFHLRTFLFFSLSHPKFNQNFKIFSLIAITYIVLALEIALKKQCCDEVWIQTSNKGRYTY